MNDYRLYVIWKIPQLKILDFQRVSELERKDAEEKFKNVMEDEEMDKSRGEKLITPEQKEKILVFIGIFNIILRKKYGSQL